jgi:ATP-dependent Clp protease adaptor protein ClpS
MSCVNRIDIAMAEEESAPPPTPAPAHEEADSGSSTATAAPPKAVPKKTPPKHMPRWRVLLHNDDVNNQVHVVVAILHVTPLSKEDAINRMFEAHKEGVALLLTTHQELAELYQEQLTSYSLTVTIEPEEG